MKHQRDETGHWLAGLSEPTLAMRGFLTAHDELQRRQARRMGMNATDMQALRMLDVEGSLGPSELARRLDMRSASVTALLDRLEVAGFIERIRADGDRRRVEVRALPHAVDMLFDTWAPIVRALDDVGHGQTASQREVVCTFFEAITAVLERPSDDC